jgi:hypothetical protein
VNVKLPSRPHTDASCPAIIYGFFIVKGSQLEIFKVKGVYHCFLVHKLRPKSDVLTEISFDRLDGAANTRFAALKRRV